MQGTSACLLREAMARAARVGYNVVLHVHDELVAEVPESFTDVKRFEALVADVPGWASGLPLKAKGYIAKRYRKG